jgi:hypothetical protein
MVSGVQGGQLTPIDLIVEEHFHRAAPGGMGGTKAAGNYSPVLVTQLAAKKQNYAGEGWQRAVAVSTVEQLFSSAKLTMLAGDQRVCLFCNLCMPSCCCSSGCENWLPSLDVVVSWGLEPPTLW